MRTNKMTVGILRAAGACAGLVALAMAAGCASDGGGHAAGEPVNVGLDTLAAEGADTGGPSLPYGDENTGNQSLGDLYAQQARDLDAVMARAAMNTDGAVSPTGATPTPTTNAAQPQPPAATAQAEPPPAVDQQGTDLGTGMGIGLGDLMDDGSGSDARVEALADQIEQLVATRVATSNSPMRDALALIAADLLRPGGPKGDAAIDQQTLDALAPSERQTLEALRASLRELAGAPPESMAGALQGAAEKLQQALGVRIGRVELCSRVDKFGSFVPFAGPEFLARSANAALVYVEVERFSHRALTSSDRAATPGDRWAVDLSQELRLYHKADGRLAWRGPTERIVDTSRNRRRDFYLVTKIDLPSALTVGSYELQVTITDETTGSVDQFAVPIGIVADPSLVTARP